MKSWLVPVLCAVSLAGCMTLRDPHQEPFGGFLRLEGRQRLVFKDDQGNRYWVDDQGEHRAIPEDRH
jgi:hypothetical protein